MELYTRDCPLCNCNVIYTTKVEMNRANKHNKLCRSCVRKGKSTSFETKQLMSEKKKGINNPFFGKRHTKSVLEQMSKNKSGENNYWYKKSLSEEHKLKLRIKTCNYIKKLQSLSINPRGRANPKACEFIDRLNKEKGWNLQHALNGGEVELYGYFVDGYDKDKNIIIEYDEPFHHRKNRKNRDLQRQNRIIQHFKSKNINVKFLRYDEKNNYLYIVN